MREKPVNDGKTAVDVDHGGGKGFGAVYANLDLSEDQPVMV